MAAITAATLVTEASREGVISSLLFSRSSIFEVKLLHCVHNFLEVFACKSLLLAFLAD
jgi:hypothetical protein